MRRVEMALFKAILDCQEFELRGVPPDLRILQACGSNLYYAGFPVLVFLKQDKSKPVDGRVSHHVQGVLLFVGLEMLELCQVLYDVVELLLVQVRPMELCALGRESSKFVCSHSVIRAKLP